jgi:hypothetical protein
MMENSGGHLKRLPNTKSYGNAPVTNIQSRKIKKKLYKFKLRNPVSHEKNHEMRLQIRERLQFNSALSSEERNPDLSDIINFLQMFPTGIRLLLQLIWETLNYSTESSKTDSKTSTACTTISLCSTWPFSLIKLKCFNISYKNRTPIPLNATKKEGTHSTWRPNSTGKRKLLTIY